VAAGINLPRIHFLKLTFFQPFAAASFETANLGLRGLKLESLSLQT
jgi:hypothetical protein